jgi:hypothetical protein
MTDRIFVDSNGRKHINNEPRLHPSPKEPVHLSGQQLRDMCQTYGWDDSYQSMKAYRTVEAMSLHINSLEK